MKTRNTLQKSLVMDAVNSLPHPTADQVYHRVTAAHPTISRGTVYRNLGLLVRQGALRRVEVPAAADRFDVTVAGHYHIRCRICGRVDDSPLTYQPCLIDSIPDTGGYLVEDHDIMLRGICPACRTRLESENHTVL